MTTATIKTQRPGIPAIDPNLPEGLQAVLGPMKENIEISNGLRSGGPANSTNVSGWSRRSVTLGMLVQLGIITQAQAISVWQNP